MKNPEVEGSAGKKWAAPSQSLAAPNKSLAATKEKFEQTCLKAKIHMKFHCQSEWCGVQQHSLVPNPTGKPLQYFKKKTIQFKLEFGPLLEKKHVEHNK